MYPDDMKYSAEHEWVRMDGNIAEIGITDFARDSLGDVVFVDLPETGAKVEQFAKFGEIESVKAVSDLFSPISGKIIEINRGVVDNPSVINDDPHRSGWLMKVEITDPSQLDELMDSEAYKSMLA